MLYEFPFTTKAEAQRVQKYYEQLSWSTVATWLDEVEGTWILIVNRIPDTDEPLHTRISYGPGRRRGDAA